MKNKNQLLWYEKHRPTLLSEIKSSDVLKKSLEYMTSYTTPRPTRQILLFSGPPGTGKTTFAKLIATACNVEYRMVNCSLDRNFASIKSTISPLVKETIALEGYSKSVIILDELDGYSKRKERSADKSEESNKLIEFLISVLKLSTPDTNPIIATCNDSYKFPPNFVSDYCIELKFKRVYDSTIRNILINIALKEGYNFTNEEIDSIIIKGDIRASISALQIYAMSGYKLPQISRDRTYFNITSSCLSKKTTIPKLKHIKMENLLAWIEENGHIKISGLDRYYFYKIINDVDKLILQYNEKEARKLLGLISFCKPSIYHETEEYIPLQKSSILTKKSLTYHINNTINSLSLKMCKDFNKSFKEFYEFIFPIIQIFSINDINYARYITTKYSLISSEIALLLDTTVSDPRINKCLVPETHLLKSIKLPEFSTQQKLPSTSSEEDMFL